MAIFCFLFLCGEVAENLVRVHGCLRCWLGGCVWLFAVMVVVNGCVFVYSGGWVGWVWLLWW